MPTYLYGLILGRNASRAPANAIGIDRAPVRIARCGDLAAIVSTLDAVPSRQNLDAIASHDRALSLVVRQGITAAATRFGQAFADDRALCAELAAFAARLTDMLDRYDGYGEMRVIMRDVLAPTGSLSAPSASRSSPGHAYLESVRDRIRPRPPVDFRALLGDLVLDERVERRNDVHTISHLVRFEDEAAYRAALAADSALREAKVVGPHALHDFAEPG